VLALPGLPGDGIGGRFSFLCPPINAFAVADDFSKPLPVHSTPALSSASPTPYL